MIAAGNNRRPARQRARLYLATVFYVLVSCLAGPAPADENWLDGTGIRLQTLDKITARIATLQAPLNRPVRFGTLEITARHCAYRPPEFPPDTAGFLVINDVGYSQADNNTQQTVFSGWMFASSPALSGLEHPVYDVTVLDCLR